MSLLDSIVRRPQCAITVIVALIVASYISNLTVVAQPLDEAAPRKLEECAVSGRVITTEGVPLAGATVEWGHHHERFEQRQRVTTDAEGYYTITLNSLDGRCHFAASAPGYLTRGVNSGFNYGRHERTFVLAPSEVEGTAVAGTVVDEQGAPIAGVRVEAYTPVVGFNSSFSTATGRFFFAGPDRVDTTDELGRFRITNLYDQRRLRIDGLPPGEVQLNLRVKHRHVNDTNYPLREDLQITMSGSGETGVIQGQLIDAETGLPPVELSESRVVLRHVATPYECLNADGSFRLPILATLRRSSMVYLHVNGYTATAAKMTAVPTDSNEYEVVELHPAPPLRGRLVDAKTDEPISGAMLLYGCEDVARKFRYFEWGTFDKYVDGYYSLSFVQRDTSSDTGEFWFAEPADASRGTIVVLVDGYQRLILQPPDRQFDEATGELMVRLQPESAITGVVFVDGDPAADCHVSVAGPRVDDIEQWYEGIKTNEHGHFKYGRLAPGTYRLRGARCNRTVTIGEGETVAMNLGEDPGSIRIHGTAPRGMVINLRPQFEWEYSRLSDTANTAGEYEIRGLKPGKYVATVHNPDSGYRRATEMEIEITHDGQPIDFVRHPRGMSVKMAAVDGGDE